VDASVLRRMADLIKHRGPDSEGVYTSNGVGFSFRRLAILDLSSAGKQPMVSADGRVVLVMNGEVYNFKELRDELVAKGVTFRGDSDTEVVLALYQDMGERMFARLNGMFSIAIHDIDQDRVVFARDRLGKKPLHLWRRPSGGFAFGSEIKALRTLSDFPKGASSSAIGAFLRLGIVPSWTGLNDGIVQIQASSFLVVDLKSLQISPPVKYWSLPSPETDDSLSDSDWIDRIEAVVDDATRIRLRSDVPVGVFLSGGIDSGVVAAAAARQATGLRSYTIGVPGWGGDEWPAAKSTAAHLGLDPVHREVGISEITDFEDILGHFDEPFADFSALPTNMVCKAAREDLKVVLSGDGGDELFAGYGNHLRAGKFSGLERIPLWIRRIVAVGGAMASKSDSQRQRFFRRLGQPVGFWGLGSVNYPFSDWVEDKVISEYVLPASQLVEESSTALDVDLSANALEDAQRFDIRHFMQDDILVKVDRMSMYHSLEVRSPLLDYRVLETALRIPVDRRTRDGLGKHYLRGLADRRLPKNRSSAKKLGFSLPIHEWLYGKGTEEFFKAHYFASGLIQERHRDSFWELGRRRPDMKGYLFRIAAYNMWKEKNS